MDVDFILEDFPSLKYIADHSFSETWQDQTEVWKTDSKNKWEESSSQEKIPGLCLNQQLI